MQQWRYAGVGLVFFGILFGIAGINRMRLELGPEGKRSFGGLIVGVVSCGAGVAMLVLGLMLTFRL